MGKLSLASEKIMFFALHCFRAHVLSAAVDSLPYIGNTLKLLLLRFSLIKNIKYARQVCENGSKVSPEKRRGNESRIPFSFGEDMEFEKKNERRFSKINMKSGN